MINYYILDTETTGLKADYHEIVQISLIRYSDKFQSSVNIKPMFPDRTSSHVLQIINKTRSELLKGKPKEEAVKYIHDLILDDGLAPKDRCIIAHNYSFDQRFCHSLWASVNMEFPADMWLCTQSFAKLYAKQIGLEKFAKQQNQPKAKFGLDMCLKAAGIQPKSGQHNAVIDTQNTAAFAQFLFDQKLNHVSLIKRKPHNLNSSVTNSDLDITDF